MSSKGRLGWVLTTMAVVVAVNLANVWGDSATSNRDKPLVNGSSSGDKNKAQHDEHLVDDLAKKKFESSELLTYRTKEGKVLFALQLKPTLEAKAARPRDILVMLDTSASQAGFGLTAARGIAEELVKQLKDDDKVSIWTVNVPKEKATRDLTEGFVAPTSEAVKKAFEILKEEVPMGDTDLKHGLENATNSFRFDEGRERVLVFLGDGMSIHNPVSTADRTSITDKMARNEIAFYSVPLGVKFDHANLHGIASATGGTSIRLNVQQDSAKDVATRLLDAARAPILYGSSLVIPGEQACDVLPTRMPPLRGDVPTLVVGELRDAKELTLTLEGRVHGKQLRQEKSVKAAAPELDNFFLVGMVQQWKNAKDVPALMRADRALAYAHETTNIARIEYLAQGEMALAKDKYDAALKLFGQASQLDPNDEEAKAGIKLVSMLKDGKISKKDLRKKLDLKDKAGVKKPAGNAVAKADEPKAPEPAPKVEAPAKEEKVDLIKQQKQKQAVEEQRVKEVVDDILVQARKQIKSDPDGAYDLLKRNLNGIRDNPDLSEAIRKQLETRLENGLRDVAVEGRKIKLDLEETARRVADSRRRFEDGAKKLATEELLKERMRQFHELMNEGRYERAFQLANAARRDARDSGERVPVSVVAAYDMSQPAFHKKELVELQRVREERYLMSFLQVDRAFVPFYDDPPIHFPPAAQWRQMSNFRRDRYESSGLIDDDPQTIKRIRELRRIVNMPLITFDEEVKAELKEVLNLLSVRAKVSITIDEAAFQDEPGENRGVIGSKQVSLPPLRAARLDTVLRMLAKQVGGTYIIRPDYLEITSEIVALEEKTVRLYPVLDLVIPTPSQVVYSQVIQNASLTNLGSPGFAGGFGMVGMGAMGMGAMGMGAMGMGAMGMGMPAMGMGMPAMGMGMPAMGMGGMGMAPPGFGSPPVGNAGYLGGQFGFAGGDLSNQLLQMITQVVAKGEWDTPAYQPTPGTGLPGAPGGIGGPGGVGGPGQPGVPGAPPPEEEPMDPIFDKKSRRNSIGYFQGAGALMVRATSRVHTRISSGRMVRPPMEGNLVKPGNGALVKNDDPKGKPVQVVNNKPDQKLDPKQIWQNALARGTDDSGLIIACADFLFENREFEHAAEFLKANLRQGIVVRPWVFEALAIAIRESGGSPDDVERAVVSGIDLEPNDAEAFVKASHAMAEGRRYDRALAFCKQASQLDPMMAQVYADALGYAELAKDTESMKWAASKLLSQDWPERNQDLHASAADKVKALARVLDSEQRGDEAGRLREVATSKFERDLKIELQWEGEAGLDLEIKEPIGTTCSTTQTLSPGGGMMVGDLLAKSSQVSYVAAQAFPGNYEITVRRSWGSPMGKKAVLVITTNKGTARERVRREMFVLDRTHTIKVTLEQGRRDSLADINPDAATPSRSTKADAPKRTVEKLRELAQPDYISTCDTVRGGSGSGIPNFEPRQNLGTRVPTQAKAASSFVNNGLEMTTQTFIEGKEIRLRLNPVFNESKLGSSKPAVNNPLIPGGK